MIAFLRFLRPAVLKRAKNRLGPIFKEKRLNFEKFIVISNQKTRIEQFKNSSLSLKIKQITLPLTILTYFDGNLVKNTENVNKHNGI